MKVAADSGPLMALAKIGALGILHRLYDEVLLAGAVHVEVVVRGSEAGYEDAEVVRAACDAGELAVVRVGAGDIPCDLATLPLEPGEVETLHVAQREGTDLALIDDMRARREARARGLAVKGTLGVLFDAYRVGIIAEGDLRRLVGAIVERDDIWIAGELCERALAALGTP